MKGTKLLKQIYIASAVLFCVGITGCRDKVSDIYKGGKEEPEKVPNDFDFSTRKDVEINLQYDVPTGYNVRFEMFTENPLSLNEAKDYVKDTTLNSFLEGYTDENGKMKRSVSVPAFAKDIYVYSPSLSVPVLLHASVNGNVVSEFKSVKVEPRSVSTSRGVNKGEYYDNWSTHNVKLVMNNVNNISRKEITSNEKKIIDASLPIGLSPDITVNSTYQQNHFTLQDEATIELYFVSHNGSERINSLAYFTYAGSNIPGQKIVNDKLILAFPTDNISEGTGVQLKDEEGNTTFKAGTTLSFALLVDANGAHNTQNINVVYSEFASNDLDHSFNSYNITKPYFAQTRNRPHMVAFKLGEDPDGNVLIGLGFEDQPWDASPNTYNRGDFRDDIFIMKVTPKSAIPDIPDGIDPDEEPEYDISSKTNGILSFEDCWPLAGDFDLNDLVIKYERALNCRMGDWKVVSIDEKYTYLHNGADYTNGFAYEIGGDVKAENIKSITITTNNGYNYERWGLDKNLEKAIVTLFDNSKKCPIGTEFNVHIVLKDAVDYVKFSEIFGTPYNPFIVVQEKYGSDNFFNQGRVEIHLPKLAPTLKHDSSLFGTEDDASNVSKNIYYVRNNESRYPFAIDLAGATNFNSNEREAIDVTYPNFIKWVESNGKDFTDWYF